MAAIINSGKQYITDNIAGNTPSDITRFILANVPHSDPVTPVDLNEVMPIPEQIVYDDRITRTAKINPDEVVYSQLLMSDVGDFDFNWIGLATDDNTLIAVVYVPIQHKRKYEQNQVGNSITRNVVLKFANAADALNVTIAPETWQFDITDFIRDEIKKGLDGHDHDDVYYSQQQIDETFVTKEALTNGQMPHLISNEEDDLVLSKLNVIFRLGEFQLTAEENNCDVIIRVDDSVDLDAGDVAFLAPEGEQLKKGNQQFPRARIVEKAREFRFIRINGEWFV